MDLLRVHNLPGRIGREGEATHPDPAITTAAHYGSTTRQVEVEQGALFSAPHHGEATIRLQVESEGLLLDLSDALVLEDAVEGQLEMFDTQRVPGSPVQSEIGLRILTETLALLSRIVPDRDRETVVGDLEEQFTTEIQPRNSRMLGWLWLWRKATFCTVHYGLYRVVSLLRVAVRRWRARA